MRLLDRVGPEQDDDDLLGFGEADPRLGDSMRATIFLATLIWPAFAQNQPPQTIADSVLVPLRMVEGQLLGVETKRCHAAGPHYSTRSKGTRPADCEKSGPSKATTKAELIQYLRDSFDYGNKGAGVNRSEQPSRSSRTNSKGSVESSEKAGPDL